MISLHVLSRQDSLPVCSPAIGRLGRNVSSLKTDADHRFCDGGQTEYAILTDQIQMIFCPFDIADRKISPVSFPVYIIESSWSARVAATYRSFTYLSSEG